MDKLGDASKKRIAIIGGGFAGIGSVAGLKEEGLEPVCFEATDKHGGTWNYREESVVGCGSTMPTTYLNHNKETGAFSVFPPKKENNIFMRHHEFLNYLEEFCEQYDVLRHITVNTEVIKVRKAEDYDDTGRFDVTVKDKVTGKVTTDTFDGVMVCNGHFNVPKMVDFPGLANFKGNVMHTHSLKDAENFKGERVLVIGSGCSGLDAVDFTSTVAKQVYLSARSGMFVFGRIGPNGVPLDYTLLRRYLTTLLDYLPPSVMSWYLENFHGDTLYHRNLHSVQPKYHALSKDPSVSDTFTAKVISGAVIQKGGVKHFTENGVVFDGEENVTEIDSVIMATGYTWKFPFLEDGLLQTENGRINLYKCMYPTHLPHSTLVFIGFINPFGPGIPIGELQIRYATQVFAGKITLPSNDEMLKDAIQRHERNERRYAPSEYQSIRVDFVNFCDEIASQFGVKPNLLKYLFTDFPLFLKLVFGPSLPYHYRLEGPHTWEGAREAIMTSDERLHFPLTKEKASYKGVFKLVIELFRNIISPNKYL